MERLLLHPQRPSRRRSIESRTLSSNWDLQNGMCLTWMKLVFSMHELAFTVIKYHIQLFWLGYLLTKGSQMWSGWAWRAKKFDWHMHSCQMQIRWLGEISTNDHWQGSKAVCFPEEDWYTTGVLLLDKCKSMDDCKTVSGMDFGLGS